MKKQGGICIYFGLLEGETDIESEEKEGMANSEIIIKS